MPQMSPMLWLNLYLYFMGIFLMMMCLIYFMMIFYKEFSQVTMKNSLNFKDFNLKW